MTTDTQTEAASRPWLTSTVGGACLLGALDAALMLAAALLAGWWLS